MKNRNIFFITIVLIMAGTAGIIAMSKIVEQVWQNTGNTDNTLSVNENNLQTEDTAFDYPYKFIGNGDMSYTEDMISFQQAANIGGEIIKYIYGVSQQSVDSCRLEVSRSNDYRPYKVPFAYNYYFTDSDGITYFMLIDAYSGQVFYLDTGGALNLYGNFNKSAEMIDEEKDKICDVVGQYLDLMQTGKEIEGFVGSKSVSDEGAANYYFNITFTDGQFGFADLYTLDNSYYFLRMLAYSNEVDTSA